MNTVLKTLILAGFVVVVVTVDFAVQPASPIVRVREAEAIIGLPFTPLSFAGVARRTTRRALWAGAAAASTAAYAAAAYAPPSTTVVVNPPATGGGNPPPPAGGSSATSAVPIGTVVHALPSGCTPIVVSNVRYSDCAGVYYKTAFQGNNVVYVVVQKPLP
jgi:hypothetical protein